MAEGRASSIIGTAGDAVDKRLCACRLCWTAGVVTRSCTVNTVEIISG